MVDLMLLIILQLLVCYYDQVLRFANIHLANKYLILYVILLFIIIKSNNLISLKLERLYNYPLPK